jgi:endonuclease YncB( thermonuclease family)
MKKQKIVFGVYLLLACCLPFSSVFAWEGYVVKVLDGDSLRIKKDNRIIEVRLYGIDAPEWGQDFGNKAKKSLKKKVYHRYVTVSPKDIDRYGRTVALVSDSQNLVNRELVREGLAWMYPKYCREQPLCSELKRLQKKARKRRAGLWRDKKPLSPWYYKWQKNKLKKRRRSHKR